MTKHWRALGGALLLGGTAACGGEGAFDAWCNTPGTETQLLFGAVALGTVGWIVGLGLRKRALGRWDLRDSPGALSIRTFVWSFAALFVGSGLVLWFVLSGADGCAPEQKQANTLFLGLGMLGGAALCLIGLEVANRRNAGRER